MSTFLNDRRKRTRRRNGKKTTKTKQKWRICPRYLPTAKRVIMTRLCFSGYGVRMIATKMKNGVAIVHLLPSFFRRSGNNKWKWSPSEVLRQPKHSTGTRRTREPRCTYAEHNTTRALFSTICAGPPSDVRRAIYLQRGIADVRQAPHARAQRRRHARTQETGLNACGVL